jgi:hypothetical protein
LKEDSGAFKTIPRNSAQIGHFVIAGMAAAKMPHCARKITPGDCGLVAHILSQTALRRCDILESA